MMQEQNPSRGFQSSMDYVIDIGLGALNKIDSLRIIWPNDQTEMLTDVNINQTLELSIENAKKTYTYPHKKPQDQILREINNDFLAEHHENLYTDFDMEGLIYGKLSQEGPALATADINGDGNEDFFIGGAKGQPGKTYLNLGNGKFQEKKQPQLDLDALFEDTAAAFADVDNDNDQDLIIGSGGNEMGEEKNYIPRLYLNDGKGNFTPSAHQLPAVDQNISTIAPYDYDNDGDIDIFVGSRSVVSVFGVDPKHLLIENNGDGTFTDVTEKRAFDLKYAGMITSAIWEDMDGDNIKDLVVSTDWGAAKIFKNSGRGLSNWETTLSKYSGWWNTVEAADLDNDGDMDLILGNKGSNIAYRASQENPVRLWINDYDDNGTIEQIMTIHEDGGDYPIHMKKEITSQLPSLKKENLKASDYAQRPVEELFKKAKVEKAIVREVNTMQSVIAINNGDGNFEIKDLPSRVQLSCVCGISCEDVNGDGNLDLIMAGNNFEFKPQFSRLDAGYGNILLGDGKLNFKWQDYATTGFNIRDEVKFIKTISDKQGHRYVIAAINNKKPRIFEVGNN